jgi:hypothetical protein
MNRIFSGVIDTDHHQIYFYDRAIEPYAYIPPRFSMDSSRNGYICVNKSMICLLTHGVNEIRWVEIYICDPSECLHEFSGYERLLSLNISISSGQLGILNNIDGEIHCMNVPSENYIAYIFEFNLDVDDEDDAEDFAAYLQSLQSIENRTDREHYKIVLVPGRTEKEGVIKGEQYLY